MREFYFAYGSNMSNARLRNRVPAAHSLGRAQLAGFRRTWNKPGRDGSGTANIVVAEAATVWGVLYALPGSAWRSLDGIELDYAREIHSVLDQRGECVGAQLYRWHSKPDAPDRAPHDWYRGHLLEGAREHELPDEVIADLLAAPMGDLK
jgi:gamma-glutamylcyclotransferase